VFVYKYKEENYIILFTECKELGLNFIKRIFKYIDKTTLDKNETSVKKSSKLQALERLKEIHNYDYINFVANYYRTKHYTVWEYSKEKNLVNYPLNLVMKRGKEIFLTQCRSNMDELTLEDVMRLEEIKSDLIGQYKLFENYNIFYLYICSDYMFTKEAMHYINKNENVSYVTLKEYDEVA
jgi:hypothetical protein